MVARFSAHVQTGPRAHPASCTIGTVSFPGVKSGQGVTLTPHPFYCRGQERVELYLYSPYGPYGLYRASVPVQGCTLPFTFTSSITVGILTVYQATIHNKCTKCPPESMHAWARPIMVYVYCILSKVPRRWRTVWHA